MDIGFEPFTFPYVISWMFLERKLGHPFLEGKAGQPVQNLLQVTVPVRTPAASN
ncbi:MAG: hypothetical protein V7K69_28535 [Nostoc sp.]|uniref:hypothetical protein n=1 Tax=Nostoc sp. TaxID=1180 RepID=UPI002FF982DC